MSPRPSPQPVTRAPRPTHPLAREASAPNSDPLPPGQSVDRTASRPADQQTLPAAADIRSRRAEVVFSTRLPADLKKRLRRYAFEHDLLVQDIVAEVIEKYLKERANDA